METNSNIIIQSKFEQRSILESKCKELINSPKFQKISRDISSNKTNIKKALSNLEKQNCPLKEDEHLFGLIKSLNTKDSFIAMYDKMKELSTTSYNAIDSCNKNMEEILELMKILATTERDIYDMIDQNELSVVEISSIIKEICRNANIKDETIEELFNQTFQRSYTLRDRIRELRNDLEKRIEDLEIKFTYFDQAVENNKKELSEFVNTHKVEIQSDCKTILDNFKKTLEKDIEETRILLNSISENAENNKKNYQSYCDSILSNFEIEINNFTKEKESQLNNIQLTCEEVKKNITQTEANFQKTLNVLENNFKTEILAYANDKISRQNEQLEILKNEITELKKKNFLDSYLYKALIGLVSASALVLSLI